MDPGLQNWNSQWLSKHRDAAQDHIFPLIATKSLISIIYLIVIGILSFVFSYSDPLLLILLGLNLILSTTFSLGRTILSSLGHYRYDSLLSALDKTLLLLIIGGLLWAYSGFSLYTYVLGQMAAFLISNIILIMLMLGMKIKVHWRVSWSQIVFILRQCLPFLYILLFMTAYSRLDGVMLGRMLDDDNFQAGIYATAFRFYDASNMVAYLFAVILLPMFSAQIFQKEQLQELVSLGVRMMVPFSTLITLIFVMYGEYLISLQFDENVLRYYQVLILLSVSFFFVSFTYIFGTFLLAAEQVKRLNIVFGIALIINFSANLLLIPRYGAVGAAWATVGTQLFVLVSEILLSKSLLPSILQSPEAIKIGLFIVANSALFWIIAHALNAPKWVGLSLNTIFFILLFFFLKIIPIKEIKYLFSQRIQPKP